MTLCQDKQCNLIRKERDFLGITLSRAKRRLESIAYLAWDGKLSPKEVDNLKQYLIELDQNMKGFERSLDRELAKDSISK